MNLLEAHTLESLLLLWGSMKAVLPLNMCLCICWLFQILSILMKIHWQLAMRLLDNLWWQRFTPIMLHPLCFTNVVTSCSDSPRILFLPVSPPLRQTSGQATHSMFQCFFLAYNTSTSLNQLTPSISLLWMAFIIWERLLNRFVLILSRRMICLTDTEFSWLVSGW